MDSSTIFTLRRPGRVSIKRLECSPSKVVQYSKVGHPLTYSFEARIKPLARYEEDPIVIRKVFVEPEGKKKSFEAPLEKFEATLPPRQLFYVEGSPSEKLENLLLVKGSIESSSLVHLFKSNIQKCIRRGLTYKSLRTIYLGLTLFPQEMLRRLTIIAIEDVVPLPGYACLVWYFLATSKGYSLTNEDVCWILGYTEELCKFNPSDPLPPLPRDPLTIKKGGFPKYKERPFKSPSNITHDERAIIEALSFRRVMGGSEGDLNLVTRAQSYWYSLFSLNKDSPNRGLWRLASEVDICFIDPRNFWSPKLFFGVTRDEWLGRALEKTLIESCVDQHSSNIHFTIQREYPHLGIEDIKGAIWFCRSSVNVRKGKVVDKKFVVVWADIKDRVSELSVMTLNSKINSI
jgi:hypothetical protein